MSEVLDRPQEIRVESAKNPNAKQALVIEVEPPKRTSEGQRFFQDEFLMFFLQDECCDGVESSRP